MFTSGDNDVEEWPAHEMLALDPEKLEVYQYFFGNQHNRSCTDGELIQPKLQRMIKDYVDVGHIDAAMEIIDMSIASKRKPPHEEDEEIMKDEIPECGLDEFDDFWHLVALCLSSMKKDKIDMQMKCHRIVLNVLLSVLEHDINARKDEPSQLAECLFLDTLRKDSYGCRSQFDRYLDILFMAFDTQQCNGMVKSKAFGVEGIDIAGRLLNMLVVLAYCDNLVTMSSLLEQTYLRFSRLSASDTATFLQAIRCSTFASALCDLGLSDVDSSLVEEQYKHLRKSKGPVFKMERVLHYSMKTRPLRLSSLQDVYRHVLLVAFNFAAFMNECSVHVEYEFKDAFEQHHHQHKALTSLSAKQLLDLKKHGQTAVESWQELVNGIIDELRVRDEAIDHEVEQKIWHTVELTKLNFENF
ncbi:hypothetical protein EC973_005392 [Apophysomyces ossiformis]|uniref:Uncharacterized protein n=1 Tax=Apophysomyces ossiformis TaxID=679940 RepID=A0A8H7ELB9_9FUNG|nr:hypothetical protein EC973_005392 [Apophysomyces ossiformis]